MARLVANINVGGNKSVQSASVSTTSSNTANVVIDFDQSVITSLALLDQAYAKARTALQEQGVK